MVTGLEELSDVDEPPEDLLEEHADRARDAARPVAARRARRFTWVHLCRKGEGWGIQVDLQVDLVVTSISRDAGTR
jgi:hypothetical protein